MRPMKLAPLLLALGCGSAPSRPAQPPPPAQAPVAVAPQSTPPPPARTEKAPAQYSCFAYASKNSATKRHACSRSDECAGYLDQARGVPGLKDFSGCELVASVFCFHQVGSHDDPDGEEICQPTLDECKTGRADVVKAKMAVDSECAPR